MESQKVSLGEVIRSSENETAAVEKRSDITRVVRKSMHLCQMPSKLIELSLFCQTDYQCDQVSQTSLAGKQLRLDKTVPESWLLRNTTAHDSSMICAKYSMLFFIFVQSFRMFVCYDLPYHTFYSILETWYFYQPVPTSPVFISTRAERLQCSQSHLCSKRKFFLAEAVVHCMNQSTRRPFQLLNAQYLVGYRTLAALISQLKDKLSKQEEYKCLVHDFLNQLELDLDFSVRHCN